MFNPIITCTRILEFDAGHRVLGHEGKCSALHGHRYKVEITCQADVLNSLGMVIDFGDVKRLVGQWIDENWDHTCLFNEKDPILDIVKRLDKESKADFWGRRFPYVMPGQMNPTAENIALCLLNVAKRLLKERGLEVVSVKVFETPNCHATVYEKGFNV